jgi:hypothetical protein
MKLAVLKTLHSQNTHGYAVERNQIMIAVIFEVVPNADLTTDYFQHAANLKSALEAMGGFISVERFESVTQPGKFYRSPSGAMKRP